MAGQHRLPFVAILAIALFLLPGVLARPSLWNALSSVGRKPTSDVTAGEWLTEEPVSGEVVDDDAEVSGVFGAQEEEEEMNVRAADTLQCDGRDNVDCSFQAWSSPAWPTARSMVKELRKVWTDFAASIPAAPPAYPAQRGIIITAGAKDMMMVPSLLFHLRHTLGCELPIEVAVASREELPADVAWLDSFEEVALLDLGSLVAPEMLASVDTHVGRRRFQVKPLALLHTRFTEVILLDADNMPLRNPSFLFDEPSFKATGAIFWPDLWKTSPQNPMWDIVGRVPSRRNSWEQESGQMVVDKARSWAALNLAFLFNTAPFVRFLNGDKDSFRFAWLALAQPYTWVRTAVAVAGFKYGAENSEFCGHSLLQHDLQGNPLFLHHTGLKTGPVRPAGENWAVIKRSPPKRGNYLPFFADPMPAFVSGAVSESVAKCVDLVGEGVQTEEQPLALAAAEEAYFHSLLSVPDAVVESSRAARVLAATEEEVSGGVNGRLLAADANIIVPPILNATTFRYFSRFNVFKTNYQNLYRSTMRSRKMVGVRVGYAVAFRTRVGQTCEQSRFKVNYLRIPLGTCNPALVGFINRTVTVGTEVYGEIDTANGQDLTGPPGEDAVYVHTARQPALPQLNMYSPARTGETADCPLKYFSAIYFSSSTQPLVDKTTKSGRQAYVVYSVTDTTSGVTQEARVRGIVPACGGMLL